MSVQPMSMLRCVTAMLLIAATSAALATEGEKREGVLIEFTNKYRGPDRDFILERFFDDANLEQFNKNAPKESSRDVFYRTYKENFLHWSDPEELIDEVIHVAYFDLNDDGADELLVSYEETTFFCTGTGLSGCDLTVYEKQNGTWVSIGGTRMSGTEVTDERVEGYRTLKSSITGLRWNAGAGAYLGFCIDFSTRAESDTGCY